MTPASGYIANQSAFFIGTIVGIVSKIGGGWFKEKLELDDVLDVCSLQAIPGVVGSILLAFLAEKSTGVRDVCCWRDADWSVAVRGYTIERRHIVWRQCRDAQGADPCCATDCDLDCILDVYFDVCNSKDSRLQCKQENRHYWTRLGVS